MSQRSRISGVFLCLAAALILGAAGCGSAATGPAAAPEQDELTKYLAENPDIANAEPEEMEEEPAE